MANTFTNPNTPNNAFAFDINLKPLSKTDSYDVEAINQSITNILSTIPGERLFNPYFGSPLFVSLFENITEDQAKTLMNNLIKAINNWEDRIVIIPEACGFILNSLDHVLDLKIVYFILKTNQTAEFKRKVVF